MADGLFYRDLIAPPLPADEASITLSTTQKALWVPARTLFRANYWRVGKAVKLTAFGKLTTDVTAGNYVFGIGYGAGDAPTPIVTGATVAGTVSQTNITWKAEGYAECRAMATPTTATFRFWGHWFPSVTVLASTLQPYLIPNSAPADTTNVDITLATNALTFQLQRSGAGVWTALTTNIFLEALN